MGSAQLTSAIPTILQLHLLVVIFAATTVLGRLASVSAAVLVSWRCLIACLGAFFWVVILRDRAIWIGGKKIIRLVGVGVLIGLHWLCLFGAVKVSNVSIALAGLATLSFFTAFAEPLLTHRKVRGFEVALGVLVLAGIALVAGAETHHVKGLCLALLSALLAAVFLVLNRTLVIGGVDPMVMVGWEMAAAAGVCFFAVPVFDPGGMHALMINDPVDWLWIGILAVICTVFAQAWTNHLLRKISAYQLNLVANFEPVYGMLAAAYLFREYAGLTAGFYAGTVAIVLANFLHPWLQRRAGG